MSKATIFYSIPIFLLFLLSPFNSAQASLIDRICLGNLSYEQCQERLEEEQARCEAMDPSREGGQSQTRRNCLRQVAEAMAELRNGQFTGENGDPVAPSNGGAGGNATFNVAWQNPLSFDSIEELVIVLLNALIVIAIPIVVLMIVYSGFLYVTARGNAEQTKTASRALTYAVIGGILIIGAVAITGIMEQAISEFRSTP